MVLLLHFVLFKLLVSINKDEIEFTPDYWIYLGFSLSVGLLVIQLVKEVRASNTFWEYSKKVINLIEEAETSNRLNLINENEFKRLSKLSISPLHNIELNRIQSILITKYKIYKRYEIKK
jgi:hypothetical protein